MSRLQGVGIGGTEVASSVICSAMCGEVEFDVEEIEFCREVVGVVFLDKPGNFLSNLLFLAAARMPLQPSLVAMTVLPKPRRAKVRPAAVIPVLPESSPPTAMLNRVAPITPPNAVSVTPATFILCIVLAVPAFTALKDA